ncbi:MAG TPA: 6,7-dimethyl-8-ribityllumazine synthase [bacterium]|nr:6,7-dimethyl-8-ribityllumazine synthase [bacterium]
MPTIEGEATGDRRLALVVARFNEFVTRKLKAGALQALEEKGVPASAIDEIPVPGAFEIPLAARVAAESGRYHAVICLGAVIRGGTPHFDYVAGECARGVARVALDTGVPVIFGVLTTNDVDQALDRAGGAEGNKGRDCALAALEMASLLEKLKEA